MKKINLYHIALLSLLISLNSCVGLKNTQRIRSASMYPSYNQLRTKLSDYKLIATEQVTVQYKVYFGFITILNDLNEKSASYRNVDLVQLNGPTTFFLSRNTRRAAFANLVKYPDAEFIAPVSVLVEKEKMFLGRSVKETFRFKVYKLNDNK